MKAIGGHNLASITTIPVREYLSTTYRPDCDFLEGELKERNVGEQPHAHVQGILARIFGQNRAAWQTRCLPEQRVQVRMDRYRVPDICVLRRDHPKDPIITLAPLLLIEILSRDDSLREMQERVNDYIAMGVGNVWVVDPWRRVGYDASNRGFQQPEDGVLRIAGTPIAISLAEVFAELDEA